MSIPIENIYYLLSYAWNKLEEKEKVKVDTDDKTQLVDLFAKILINASKILLKRGIDKSYIGYEDEIAGVKGKLSLAQTLKQNLLFKQRTICVFDEFSSNTLLNQILVTSLYRLVNTKGLDKELSGELTKIRKMFPDIDQIELTASTFNRIRLNRNNRFYGFIMNVRQIIHESTLPSEEPGKLLFADFTRDDKKMNRLFESFIRNFYRIEQRKFTSVSSEIIDWQFGDLQSSESDFLPQMKTDITLQNDSEKVIIDAKYYSQTMAINFDNEKIHSDNLYQLFSYLLNQENDKDSKTLKTTGVLLYPNIESEYNLNYKYGNHNIQIRTVNLNTNWKDISNRLKDIIKVE